MGMARENILVEDFVESANIFEGSKDDPALRKRLAQLGFRAFVKMVFEDNFFHGDLHPGNLKLTREATPRILVLDFGICSELSPKDRFNFIDLFDAVARGDGRLAGALLIERASLQDCTDRAGFEREIAKVVDAFHRDVGGGRLKAGEILSKVLSLALNYRVRLESQYTSVILSILVLEGVGRTLDPGIDIIKLAAPVILKEKLKDWYHGTQRENAPA
eukprot:m.259039 g.259039  ORF g.259039 m.259039 type:complete len:218 (-) comp22134_c0_seq1:181-834(-)